MAKKKRPIVRELLPLPKAPTGIAGLDEITNGGLPKDRTTIVCGGPGCGKTMLGIEFLVRGALEFNEPSVEIQGISLRFHSGNRNTTFSRCSRHRKCYHLFRIHIAMGENMSEPTKEELLARIAELEKQAGGGKSGSLQFKVGEKGGVSVYGLGRFPVTLYYEQWIRLLDAADDIRTFLEDNKSRLKLKTKD